MTDEKRANRLSTMVTPNTGKHLIRAYSLSLLAFAVFALFPVASVVLAGLIATPAGCELNEAVVHPCVIAGIDFGELLYAMGVLGWLMIGTIPAGVILFAIWVVVLIVHMAALAIRSRPR